MGKAVARGQGTHSQAPAFPPLIQFGRFVLEVGLLLSIAWKYWGEIPKGSARLMLRFLKVEMVSGPKTWLLLATLLLTAAGCSGNGSGATSDPAALSSAGESASLNKPPLQPDKPEAVSAMKRQGVILGYDEAGRVNKLDFSPTKATNPWLAQLEGLPNVEQLDLRNTNVTDAGLVHINSLKRLSKLRLPESITDKGLESLKDLQFIEELYLDNTKVTSAGLASLKNSLHMHVLFLTGTAISDDGLPHLAGMKQLEWLNLSSTQVTDRGLPRLQVLPKLKTLNLFLLSGVTDDGLPKLGSIKTLSEIDLGFTGVTDAGVANLQKMLPTAKISH
jgi:internalin A